MSTNEINNQFIKFLDDYSKKVNTPSWFYLNLKTLLSKNITIEDWNLLQQFLKNNVAETNALYQLTLLLKDAIDLINTNYIKTVEYDSINFIIKFKLENDSIFTIDLPTENLFQNIEEANKVITVTTVNGAKKQVDLNKYFKNLVQDIEFSENKILTIIKENGTEVEIDLNTVYNPNITATVNTLEPDEKATVEVVNDGYSNINFGFGIPRGYDGYGVLSLNIDDNGDLIMRTDGIDGHKFSINGGNLVYSFEELNKMMLKAQTINIKDVSKKQRW